MQSALLKTPAGTRPCQAPPAPPRQQRQARPQGCRASASSTDTAPARSPLHPRETPDETHERRMRESERVQERVEVIYNLDEFKEQLELAGDKLVVLEVESPEVCDTGLSEEAEMHWREDKQTALSRCDGVKHVLQRTARDSPNVIFLTLEAETPEGQEAADALGVDVLPTVQFWKNRQRLWQHRGILQLEQDLGEGVLYYGDQAANGVKASQFVQDLRSRKDVEAFVSSADERVLSVVFVASATASSCVHIYAAVLALARSFQGYAQFGRLEYDGAGVDEGRELARELNVMEVPTFVFFREGREVGRHVGSSRADLIGQILQVQNKLGIAPPPPPAQNAKPRQRPQSRRSRWG